MPVLVELLKEIGIVILWIWAIVIPIALLRESYLWLREGGITRFFDRLKRHAPDPSASPAVKTELVLRWPAWVFIIWSGAIALLFLVIWIFV